VDDEIVGLPKVQETSKARNHDNAKPIPALS
jgi:hypothetical protein